jgi:hypothetical protein
VKLGAHLQRHGVRGATEKTAHLFNKPKEAFGPEEKIIMVNAQGRRPLLPLTPRQVPSPDVTPDVSEDEEALFQGAPTLGRGGQGEKQSCSVCGEGNVTNRLKHLLRHMVGGYPREWMAEMLLLDPHEKESVIFKEWVDGRRSHIPDELVEKFMSHEGWRPQPPEGEGDIFMPVSYKNDVTLDDYLEPLDIFSEPPTKEDAMFFHHFFLTSCVTLITGEEGFLVKRRDIGGNQRWQMMKPKTLAKCLARRTFPVVDSRGNVRDVGYDKWLMYHKINRDFETFQCVDFSAAGGPTSIPVFSVWRGHAHPTVPEVDMSIIRLFLDHVRDIICGGDVGLYDVEMKKNAWMYQNPAGHMGWATVLLGRQGTGKTLYTDVLCNLWGRKWSEPNVASIEQIIGDKSRSILENKKLIICNEISSTDSTHGRKINWDVVKSRITDDWLQVRSMYQDYQTPIRNVSNYIFVTNHQDSIKLEEGDRRYFVLETSDARVGNHDYYDALFESLHHPAFYPTLLTHLLSVDTSGLNIHTPIETEAKREMMESSQSYAEAFIRSDVFRRMFGDAQIQRVTVKETWGAYVQWLDEQGIDSGKYGGNRQTFWSKTRHLIDTRKIGGNQYYVPKTELLSAWRHVEDPETI